MIYSKIFSGNKSAMIIEISKPPAIKRKPGSGTFSFPFLARKARASYTMYVPIAAKIKGSKTEGTEKSL